MSKSAKIWLLAAASLVLFGTVIFLGVMTMLNWNFSKLSTDSYETNTYEINESFSGISVNTNTADIRFLPSDDEKCSVVCYEKKNEKHSVSVKDGTLVILHADLRKWFEHIGINFGAPKITVYLPMSEYGALSVSSDTGTLDIPSDFTFESIYAKGNTGSVTNYASVSEDIRIRTSTGKIHVESVSAKSIDLSVSTGNVTAVGIRCTGDLSIRVSTGKTHLTDVECKNLTSGGSTGDITLNKVIVSEKLSVTRSTGDVKLDASDAAEIIIETDTGDVKGTLLTEKIFFTQTDTGRVQLPKTSTGGKCEISTDTGDIIINIVG